NASIISSDTILTCSIRYILLSGNSASADVVYQWTDTSGIFYPDPYSISIPGVYQLHATDTINGCANVSNLIFISSWTTPPGINPLTDTLNLNCSYATLPLNASSLTSGAILNWSGPLSYSSPDPGTATQTGYYYVTATHPQNGCVSFDSVYVNYQMTLAINSGNDTSICSGSGAVLQAIPIGGTSPFNFSWNNSAGNSSLVTVYPNDTLEYIVNVTDANACVGSDTVFVNVPDPLSDSTQSFQPCDPLQPTGEIQVFAFNGVPPFQYSSDNGLSWNSTGVFPNLAYGTYNFLIQDFLGCTKNETAVIDTNSLSPAPQFLVSSGPMQGDTIVVVDISNPRPDSVRWDFPSTAIVIDSSMFAPIFVNTDTGAFPLTMHAFYGSCEVIYSRIISVHPFDSTAANQWNNNGIDTISLYPNPNNGIFNLGVTLFAKQNFVILVYDANGIERARQAVYDADNWNGQISVSNPIPGNYVLRVIAEFDSSQQLFVITQ
ncbi:MAG TPA: T9SS type A sorting domain-containing protein, partial [Bacteroidia bacterium]|nr:T9SS type A sorting domain-containing protein [Bacteroidia bacterium]